jgi:hypothetical protein
MEAAITALHEETLGCELTLGDRNTKPRSHEALRSPEIGSEIDLGIGSEIDPRSIFVALWLRVSALRSAAFGGCDPGSADTNAHSDAHSRSEIETRSHEATKP